MLQFSSAAQIEIDRTQEFFCAENLFRSLNDLLRVKEIPVKGLLICALASSFSPGCARRYNQESADSAQFANRANL